MSAPELSTPTVRYLFASEWAPPAGSEPSLHVPGAKVDALETAANLLNLAFWSLQGQGLVELEQLRPVEKERVVVLGGRSFARVRPLPGDALRLGGLEGALLRKLRERPEEGRLGRFDDWLAKKLSADEEGGVRGYVLALDLDSSMPWGTVADHCFYEALHAGLVEAKGRILKKPEIADSAAVEALEPRDAEIVAARTRYREQQPDLNAAVLSDCLAALDWARTTPD